MIASRHIAKIVAALVCVCLSFCGFIVYAAGKFDTTRVTEYQKKLFGDEVVSINIQVNADEWKSLLDNAQTKEWISADLVINGERFGTVGIRTKGNSSLSMGNKAGGSSDGNYSLQFTANKYVKGQTFYGLDSFCVNNMMGDATYMKDYIAYDIMNYIGVATPLTNYANVKVNGEDYGFGIMLERYDEAFLDRVYNTTAGELYSVKIGMGQRGDFEDMWQDVENDMPQRRQRTEMPDFGGRNTESGGFSFGGSFPAGNESERQQGGGGFGGMGRSSMGGGSLVYTDDNPDSYSSIFNNSVKNPDKITDKDKEKVITALENLNAGTDLEKYIDVDAALRYFAAHTVMVNTDSYTSNMAQNYYLYERDGQLTILPWDYNLSFGGMGGGMGGTSGASGVVNFPVDTPVSGVSMEDRPLLNKLLEVDEYREKYHDYLRQIVEGYFESGLFENTITKLDEKINRYVENDVSALFTYEQYKESIPQLIELGRLRAESIKGQLDGIIPSTSSGQNADSSALIDASSVNISALGSMGGGMGGRGNWQGNITDRQGETPSTPDRQTDEGWQQPGGQRDNPQGGFGRQGGMFDIDLMQQAMQILANAGGELTDEVKAELSEIGLTEEQIEMLANMQNGFAGMGRQGNRDRQPDNQWNTPQDGNNRQDFNNENIATEQNRANAGYVVFSIILLVILAGATVYIAKPRKSTV